MQIHSFAFVFNGMDGCSYFSDGKRVIDFVLAFRENDPDAEAYLNDIEGESDDSFEDNSNKSRSRKSLAGNRRTKSKSGNKTTGITEERGAGGADILCSSRENVHRLGAGVDPEVPPPEQRLKASKTNRSVLTQLSMDETETLNYNEVARRLSKKITKNKSLHTQATVDEREREKIPRMGSNEVDAQQTQSQSNSGRHSGQQAVSSNNQNSPEQARTPTGADATPLLAPSPHAGEIKKSTAKVKAPATARDSPKENMTQKSNKSSIKKKRKASERTRRRKSSDDKGTAKGSTRRIKSPDGKKSNNGDKPGEAAPDAQKVPPKLTSTQVKHNRIQRRRMRFHRNLQKQGVEIELINANQSGLCFALLHAPMPLLEVMATVMRVKVPLRDGDSLFHMRTKPSAEMSQMVNRNVLDQLINRKFDAQTKKKLQMQNRKQVYEVFDSSRKPFYVNGDNPDKLFSAGDRSRMVHEILRLTSYGQNLEDKEKIGIDRMLRSGVYNAAYPLHQACRPSNEQANAEDLNQRETLSKLWGNMGSFRMQQPFDLIKDYFGSKIALYFVWLATYTRMLFIPSILGMFWLGSMVWMLRDQSLLNEVCNDNHTVICPKCDSMCDFRYRNETCWMARGSYLFDHWGILICGLFITIWAQVFLKVWKRQQSAISYKWGLTDAFYQEKTVRLDFKLRCTNYRIDPVTDELEPHHTRKKKVCNALVNIICMLFVAMFIVGTLLLMLWLRTIIDRYVIRATGQTNLSTMLNFTVALTTVSSLNLIVILIFNLVYQWVAYHLVNWECPKTQLEFDNSFILKMFSAQFVNTNSSLFFLAFIQPQFTRKWPFLHSRSMGIGVSTCFSNCFVELTISMTILFVGQQVSRAVFENGIPWFAKEFKLYRSKVHKWFRDKRNKSESSDGKQTRWEEDYYLYQNEPHFMCFEYLEMVIQFGVLVLFTLAFPLAPLFALINNVIEIRTDAIKYLHLKQRPLPEEVESIGIWTPILEFLAKLSIVVNAFLIAFTSDFVPTSMYWLDHRSFKGYLNASHTVFNTRYLSQFTDNVRYHSRFFNYQIRNNTLGKRVNDSFPVPEYCMYYGPFKPHCLNNDNYTEATCAINGKIEYSDDWWQVSVYRLTFVGVFVAFLLMFRMILDHFVPDIPLIVSNKLQKEKYIAKKQLIADSFHNNNNAMAPSIFKNLAKSETEALLPQALNQGAVGPSPSEIRFRSAERSAEQTQAASRLPVSTNPLIPRLKMEAQAQRRSSAPSPSPTSGPEPAPTTSPDPKMAPRRVSSADFVQMHI